MEEKNTKKVSIIVPVYNVVDQVERCLRSIQNQSYCNFECILVDDGSTDGSDTICEKITQEDSRFIVIHQKNSGLSTARNNAMAIAGGEYIAFIDSDDYVLTDYLKTMIELMEDCDCDIVKCDYHKGIIEVDNAQPSAQVVSGREFTESLLTDKIGSQLWQYLYKKELWEGIQSPDGRYAQDMMILHEVSNKARKVCISSQKLYFYYIDRSNSTSNAPTKKVKGAFDRAIAFMIRYEFSERNSYQNCLNTLMQHVLDFYNNAEVLKGRLGEDSGKYRSDEMKLSAFLRKNRNRRGVSNVGVKYSILGKCLTYFPKTYSNIRGKI